MLCGLIWVTLFAQQYYEVTIGIWKDQQKTLVFLPQFKTKLEIETGIKQMKIKMP